MPKPTGPQFVTLYRGLVNVTPGEVKAAQVGPHWSRSPEVAYNFAMDRDVEGFSHEDEGIRDEGTRFGTVVEAKIHRRHIIDPNSEEGRGWAEGDAVFGQDHPEQERTVRPNAPVHVLKMHHFDDVDPSKDTTIVNNPLKKRYRA